ncbi:MAG: hypothetical protein RL291_1504 [Pseudomonadota bacterium]
MYVFIDASGDPGFDPKGSSPYYAAAAAIFATSEALRACQVALDRYAHRVKHRGEFRYSHMPIERRDGAVAASLEADWKAALLTFDKQAAGWRNPARDGLDFEYQIYRRLILAIEPLVGANVAIDGVGGNPRELLTLIRRTSPGAGIKLLRFVDSKKSRAIQLADLVAGAAARASVSDDAKRSKALVADRISIELQITMF